MNEKPFIFILEDYDNYAKAWREKIKETKGDEFEIVIFNSVKKIKQKFLEIDHKDLVLIICDGCLMDEYSIDFVKDARKSGFKGLIIGASSDAGINQRLFEVGANDYHYKTYVNGNLPSILEKI
jgi:response regulator of citrate/malate metabolism